MKRTFFCCLVLFLIHVSGKAQQAKPDPNDPLGIDAFLKRSNASRDQGETKPSDTIVKWKEGSTNCDRFAIDGVYFYTIEFRGVVTAIAFQDTGDYLAARILVVNNSENRVLVDPKAVEVFYEDKHGNGISLVPLDSEKIADRHARKVMWATLFSSLAANMAQRSSTVDTTSRGTLNSSTGSVTYNSNSTVVITEPDYAARRQAAARQATIAENLRVQREAFLENVLRANTLWPNQNTGGDLYFKRAKFEKGALIVSINHVDYFFVIFRNYSQ
ncbi:MAG: hypothetical protein ACXW3C_06060 [Pyrinomonadaceae bacterium]